MHPEVPSDPPARFLQLNGRDVAYYDEGTGPVTFILIPGLPGSARDFRWLAPALSATARVIRIDPPGFGQSPRPDLAPVTAQQRADLVRDLSAALELGPAILVGHSFGSVVVTLAAKDHSLASRVALIAPPGVTPHFNVPVMAAVARTLESPVGPTFWRYPLRWGFRVGGFSRSLTDTERFHAVADSGAMSFAAYEVGVQELSVPTFIAWASDDRQVPAKNVAELDRIAPPGPRLRFETGGHNLQKTMATELAVALLTFAADLD